MKASEQKEIIKDLISQAKEVLEDFIDKISKADVAIEKARELDLFLDDIGATEVLDLEDFKEKLFLNLIGDSMNDLYDNAYNFKSDIDDMISEASELKADKLEDKYYQLEEVVDYFNVDSRGYENVEEATDGIEEAIFMLKEMIGVK